MTVTDTLTKPAPPVASTGAYHYALGYLRASLVVLVVAHHAALSYHPFAPPPPVSLAAQPGWWQAFPVVDAHRGAWSATFVGFNDTFFMALMFLLSGLFVYSGVKRKGAAQFLRDRLLRLGIPFAILAGVVAPLAYYPTYLQIPGHAGFDGFLRQWFAIHSWPAGPAWFLWVLLAFDCIAALLFTAAPGWAEALGRFLAGPNGRPARLFTLLLAASAAAYLPLEFRYNGIDWSSFGPFSFQTSRILHYLVYFLAGAGLGAWGLPRSPLMPASKLARRWLLWTIAAVVVFLVMSVVAIAFITAHPQSRSWEAATDLLFAATCTASSFAFLALFLRFAGARSRVFDSLTRNSYGIYVVHYAFVSWFALWAVGSNLSTGAKFAIVTAASLAASWLTTAALRRIPGVARVV